MNKPRQAATQLAAHLRTFGAVGRWRRVQRATLRLQSWQRGHTQRAQYQVDIAARGVRWNRGFGLHWKGQGSPDAVSGAFVHAQICCFLQHASDFASDST